MHLSTQSNERSAVPLWRALVCSCLALLLLYNPYLNAESSARGLNVRHSASNRATVGASELQHFSPADGQEKHSAPATSVVEPFAAPLEISSDACDVSPHLVSHSQQFFGSSLWFRPPPAS
jgi:hypothetical protein